MVLDPQFLAHQPAPIDPPGVFAEASRLAAVELLDEHGKPAMCYFPCASTTFHSAFCSRNLRVHDLGCH